MILFKKSVLILIFPLFLFNCGFKVLNQSELLNFEVEEYSTNGDKKTSFFVKAELFKSFQNSNSKNKVNLIIKTTKEKSIKEKNISNQITKYQIKLITKVTLVYLNNSEQIIFSNTVNGSYDVSSNHSSTINNQKKLEKKLAKDSAKVIIRDIILNNR